MNRWLIIVGIIVLLFGALATASAFGLAGFTVVNTGNGGQNRITLKAVDPFGNLLQGASFLVQLSGTSSAIACTSGPLGLCSYNNMQLGLYLISVTADPPNFCSDSGQQSPTLTQNTTYTFTFNACNHPNYAFVTVRDGSHGIPNVIPGAALNFMGVQYFANVNGTARIPAGSTAGILTVTAPNYNGFTNSSFTPVSGSNNVVKLYPPICNGICSTSATTSQTTVTLTSTGIGTTTIVTTTQTVIVTNTTGTTNPLNSLPSWAGPISLIGGGGLGAIGYILPGRRGGRAG